jgi:hypothetical protein
VDTNVSEEDTTSIYRIEVFYFKDKKAVYSSETLYSPTTLHGVIIQQATVLSRFRVVTVEGIWIGFIYHLYTSLGTTSNYSIVTNLHNSQITTAPAEPFCSQMYLQQPFPINGFQHRRFFSFPRSHHYYPATISQLNSFFFCQFNYSAISL